MDSICWNITRMCNLNCEYCFRETNESDLTLNENLHILNDLIKNNIKKITWSGGEPTKYTGIEELLKIAKQYGVYNKMVSNASSFSGEQSYKIFDYLDEIVFSIDFVDDNLNQKYGRGKDYFKHICEVIQNVRCFYPRCTIGINTIVMKTNINYLDKIYEQLGTLKVNHWKLIQFCPFRGRAVDNDIKFSVTQSEFYKVQQKYKLMFNSFQIKSHTAKEMQLEHSIITPSGKMIK